jgi:filamentous hemagglutinin
MTILFDNAVREQSALSLTVGIELSAAQIKALSSDIIWLVEDEVDGQKVLKSVVYMAKATMDLLDGHGAQIAAGNDLSTTASDTLITHL